MDGQLSRKKVIGSPIYEESLERTFVEGIERSGMFQARKYLEHILNTVEKLENDYPYYPECRHLTTKSRMYRNIILDSHLISTASPRNASRCWTSSIPHPACERSRKQRISTSNNTKKGEPPVSDPPLFADI